MKKDLALRLLHTILPKMDDDEGAAADLFRELQFLADYKYNKYEMYQPGRLFLENLYLWLQGFEEQERAEAIKFVRNDLIFVSRQEFQQLAGVLYQDRIRRQQFELAASLGGYLPHKVSAIRDSAEFKQITRASLYVGMSDGARIDYIRRHTLEISNEQVLPYYEASRPKTGGLLGELRKDLSDAEAKFRCLFLIDDFCGSGRTLLREVVTSRLPSGHGFPPMPHDWRSRLRLNQDSNELEMRYDGEVSTSDQDRLRSMGNSEEWGKAVDELVEKSRTARTELRGALVKICGGDLAGVLDPEAAVFFCPLLATEHALSRLKPLLLKLRPPGPFSRTRILAGGTIDSSVEIDSSSTAMGALCEKYYINDLEDEHTGCVKFGFDGCGLPVVLHHNTPNNSIYLLWARKMENRRPLFVRYERHGRKGV